MSMKMERRMNMIKQEWKALLHNTWFKIVMVAIIVLPCIYAGAFLGSMWDPYEQVDKVPVAIVNEDKAVIYEGQELAIGEQLVKNLKKDMSMDYHFVNQEDAKSGLANNTYYMIVSIPKDFSKNATTLLENDPKKMKLQYTTNPGSNYIASKMDDTAVAKMKEEVANNVSKTYAKTLFEQIGTLSSGLQSASDGASQLNDGMVQVSDANTQLSAHLQQLATSSIAFEDGTQTLAVGLQQYSDGVVQVNQGIQHLQSGLQQTVNAKQQVQEAIGLLTQGATSLQSGVQQYSDGVSKTYAGTQGLVANNETLLSGVSQLQNASQTLQTLNSQMNTLLQNQAVHMQAQQLELVKQDMLEIQNVQQMISVVTTNMNASLNAGAYYVLQNGNIVLDASGNPLMTNVLKEQTIASGIHAYVNGVSQVDDGLAQLNAQNENLVKGSSQLSDGLQQLQTQFIRFGGAMDALLSGADQIYVGSEQVVSYKDALQTGANTLVQGAAAMKSGSGQLADGSITMQTGITTLQEGSLTLANSLHEAALKSTLKTSDKTNSMMANPVQLSHQEISEVKNNGHAMAPYMMSVALYVACLSFALMYPLLKDIDKAKSAFRYWIAKASVWFFISSVAAILMLVVLMLVNGFAPQQIAMTFVFAIIVAAGFMSLITLLSMLSGKIGEFILLVFMVINLGGSAGTYPLETSSRIYQIIHPYLPFTYSVDGFRKVISQASASITNEMVFFVVLTIICSVLSILVYKKRMKYPTPWIPQAFEENE